MKRADKLRAMRFFGYHDDSAAWTRLLIERPAVAYAKALAEWRAGQQAKLAGVPCGCPACSGAARGP